MGSQTGLARLTFLAWLTYEVAKNTILPTNMADVYAQEKNNNSKTDLKWEELTRKQKIDYLHSTDNRIMPLLQVDSTGALENLLTGLQSGVGLVTPTTINADLNYGDEFALDLTNFPMRKPYATISFKGVSFDEAFNFFYNSIDKSYTSEKDVVINKQQKKINFKEIEEILRIFESTNPKWIEYIKDGKLSDYEFKSLGRDVHAVKITSHDKNGKTIEAEYVFVNRRHDNTGKVKIVEKEVPVPYPVEVPVPHDTCITESEEPCAFGVKNLSIGLGETIYDKPMPQARIGIGNCNVEVGLKVGYSGKKQPPIGWEPKGPFGNTYLYQNQEILAGADITARIIENIRLGLGVNYRWNDFRVDEEVYSHAGNLKISKEGATVPALNREKNHPGITAAVSYSIGLIRIEGGMEFAKDYNPKKFVMIGVNF